jgi:hypothetical protein
MEVSAAMADHFESEKALQTAIEVKTGFALLAVILLVDGKPRLSHAARSTQRIDKVL